MVLGAIAGAGILIVYFWQKDKGINYGKAVILIMGNVYGVLVLVLLLGYGLFNLPLTVFAKSKRTFQFYHLLSQAGKDFQEY